MLRVTEQFKSIQGESTYAGEPCSFIRLAGCNLTCVYCDTGYARDGGVATSIEEIVRVVETHVCGLVEVTGGEPLLQRETPELCRALLDKNYTVLVETNGSLDISALAPGCVRIVDVKCPGSGMAGSFLEKNLAALNGRDQLKFVISNAADFKWANDFVATRNLRKRCTVIFSPNTDMLRPRDLAEWIIAENAPVRLGLQLHKIIWDLDTKGR
jgi:7-carboxy-7-deazaguanine synthase